MDDNAARCYDQDRYRREVLAWIVRCVARNGHQDLRSCAAEQNGVAVRLDMGHCGDSQDPASTALILDNHRAEQGIHLLRPRTNDRIGCAARRKRDDQPDWPRWI